MFKLARIYMLPAVQSLIQKWGVPDSSNCVQMWLQNEDRLTCELRRDRLLKYPEGVGFAGMFELRINSSFTWLTWFKQGFNENCFLIKPGSPKIAGFVILSNGMIRLLETPFGLQSASYKFKLRTSLGLNSYKWISLSR